MARVEKPDRKRRGKERGGREWGGAQPPLVIMAQIVIQLFFNRSIIWLSDIIGNKVGL